MEEVLYHSSIEQNSSRPKDMGSQDAIKCRLEFCRFGAREETLITLGLGAVTSLHHQGAR